jgi:hypothetical protein
MLLLAKKEKSETGNYEKEEDLAHALSAAVGEPLPVVELPQPERSVN